MAGGHGHGADHGHGSSENKKIALLIAVLALVLALAETLGKGAQTGAISYNIEASNLWAFFQAKTIRMTTVRIAAESAEVQLPVADARAREAIEKRINEWKAVAARYESEPETREGRKELVARAKASEAKRDRAMAAHHHFEVASGIMQVAIVLASAAIITGVSVLVWIAGALGIVGLAFCVIGIAAPTAVHLF
jgi:hypothetical protein